MGAGDWIMATAQVRALNTATGKKVTVVDRLGRVRWNEVFENNPRLTRNAAGAVRLLNAGGARPYIAAQSPERWAWKRWDKAPGELWLTPAELDAAHRYAGAILVEPNTKVAGSNKAWIWDRWQALVARRPGEFLQVGAEGVRRLDGVQFVATASLRQAIAILAQARAFVGTEGALHHAAAALKVPSVVLWSEFISPEFTGYETQTNIRHAGPACGWRTPCAGCRASMAAITVAEVEAAIGGIL